MNERYGHAQRFDKLKGKKEGKGYSILVSNFTTKISSVYDLFGSLFRGNINSLGLGYLPRSKLENKVN